MMVPLTPLVNTVAGQDRIPVGGIRGKAEGKRETAWNLLADEQTVPVTGLGMGKFLKVREALEEGKELPFSIEKPGFEAEQAPETRHELVNM